MNLQKNREFFNTKINDIIDSKVDLFNAEKLQGLLQEAIAKW